MPRLSTVSSRLLPRTAAGLLLLAIAGCASLPPTAAVTVPPIPAGEARVWFYRDPGPYDGLGTPYIRMNEAIVGISQPGAPPIATSCPANISSLSTTISAISTRPGRFTFIPDNRSTSRS